ncbi:SMI1/KNR4 family protein [Croceiramulus getboli]|nr:hypothetical protein P8624_06570 [Flavobacteriaceae bacterium YJPT1-3]
MIDKNLVRFLQFRDEIKDIAFLEEKYGFKLPPIFRSFIAVFKPYFAHIKVKKISQEGFQSFVVPFYSSQDLKEYTSDDDELAFESFKEAEDLFSFEPSNKGYLEDLVFISNHGYGGGLLVGIGEHNKDQIYHNADSTVIKFMANNIFELIHKMELIQFDFETPSIDTSRLYKNWGEDFWRVKDE